MIKKVFIVRQSVNPYVLKAAFLCPIMSARGGEYSESKNLGVAVLKD